MADLDLYKILLIEAKNLCKGTIMDKNKVDSFLETI